MLRGQTTIGSDGVGWHNSHAEAIDYADKHARMARTNQGENND
ncbi:hypothetical protein [Arthrobacter sp. MYb221]|nr:hypothetical protein [Arthrobacter sp. MYb221]